MFIHLVSRFSAFSLTEGQKGPVMRRRKKSKHVGNRLAHESTAVTGRRSPRRWKKQMMRRRSFFR